MNECLKIHGVAYRLYGKGRIVRVFTSFFRHLNQVLFSYHISNGAIIGSKSIFQHNGCGVVISDYAVIGENCVVYQNVTIGVNHNPREAPVIEDGALIDAGAVLLGGIRIGCGAKVSAYAVVLSSVADGKAAVGIPAKEIN